MKVAKVTNGRWASKQGSTQLRKALPPVIPGQTVYLSVLPKTDLAGNGFDASPKVFASREAAQNDCDRLNATRSVHSQFCVREMKVEGSL